MKGHLYKFTIEHLEDNKGNPLDVTPVSFKTKNHDDIFKIIELMKNNVDLDDSDATALAVGIKLFGEVLLKNRSNALFKEFMPEVSKFMKQLKAL